MALARAQAPVPRLLPSIDLNQEFGPGGHYESFLAVEYDDPAKRAQLEDAWSRYLDGDQRVVLLGHGTNENSSIVDIISNGFTVDLESVRRYAFAEGMYLSKDWEKLFVFMHLGFRRSLTPLHANCHLMLIFVIVDRPEAVEVKTTMKNAGKAKVKVGPGHKDFDNTKKMVDAGKTVAWFKPPDGSPHLDEVILLADDPAKFKRRYVVAGIVLAHPSKRYFGGVNARR